MTVIPKIQLTSDSNQVSDNDLKTWAGALQVYTDQYIAYHWHHHATVSAVPKGSNPDTDAWYIKISDSIDEPGAAGVHLDNANQPYALVEYQPDGSTSVVVSHEFAEMLADPWGNRLTPLTPSLATPTNSVRYLVELCDPCEDNRFARPINGVLLSDFITHNYFFGVPPNRQGVLSAFGNIKTPRDILTNGYISWIDPKDNNWYQFTNFEGQGSQTVNLGQMPANAKSIREWINSRVKDKT